MIVYENPADQRSDKHGASQHQDGGRFFDLVEFAQYPGDDQIELFFIRNGPQMVGKPNDNVVIEKGCKNIVRKCQHPDGTF